MPKYKVLIEAIIEEANKKANNINIYYNLDDDGGEIEHNVTEVQTLDYKLPVWSEIRDEFEDEGILHIDAWKIDDENEGCETIAKVNMTTGEVYYLDERAKTDRNAQELIQDIVADIKSFLK